MDFGVLFLFRFALLAPYPRRSPRPACVARLEAHSATRAQCVRAWKRGSNLANTLFWSQRNLREIERKGQGPARGLVPIFGAVTSYTLPLINRSLSSTVATRQPCRIAQNNCRQHSRGESKGFVSLPGRFLGNVPACMLGGVLRRPWSGCLPTTSNTRFISLASRSICISFSPFPSSTSSLSPSPLAIANCSSGCSSALFSPFIPGPSITGVKQDWIMSQGPIYTGVWRNYDSTCLHRSPPALITSEI